MAETFLSPIIEKLLQLLTEEAKSLKGVGREVESLKDELEIIQPFLRDAEAKSEKGEVNDAAKVWLKQIRKQADRIEDVVDEYLYHVEQHRHQRGFIGSLRKAGHYIKALKPVYDIASEIKDIKESLREIKDRGVGYGLRPLEHGSSSRSIDVERRDPRLGSLFMEEDEIVGIDGASKELIRRWTEGPSMRSVTSLVGQGGIGKTTLARKVYNDAAVKAHFDCCAWITVSQSYDMKKLLRITLRQVGGAGERIEEDCAEEELISLLRHHLQKQRYAIVFDDVWKKDFWEVMKHALPNNDKGSRIIITTRNVVVANLCNESCFDLVQELQTWSPEMAWQLFCKKAFCNDKSVGSCPQELEQLSREIISKCLGLPLVISTIGGLLSTKERVYSEWNHRITDRVLYKLWIAEGFVRKGKNKTLEEVAEEYLDELIQRSLVLFEVKNGVDRLCKVHDLMHDIILTRAGELCFCQTLSESKSSLSERIRRLSIHHTTETVSEMVRDYRIRSVFLFDIHKCSKSFLSYLFENFKLLKILDLQDAPLDNLPEEIGNLFHLRYLYLQGTKVKVLPKSIGKLRNLQTLDITDTLVRELPLEVNKLRNLRHLIALSINKDIGFSLDTYYGVGIREGIGRLEELQTLSRVEAYPDRVGFMKELQKLKNLKYLGILKVTAEMGKALGVSIEKMNHLEEFSLTSINEDEVLDLNNISSPPPFLHWLQLTCRLQHLPSWISKLHNLKGLELNFSRLTDEPLRCLKVLPNLAFLDMFEAYEGEELHFEEGGFQKLKELKLYNLEGLKVVKIDRGALPLLEKLVFVSFPLMKEMPPGIQHLTNLKYLKIRGMPREFVVRLQPDEGADYWKVQHVPHVDSSL
ncbi:Disease resistance protein RPM1 [Morus notabilis]|uniref:Disease resistance protein RPM1 n=1 Tax=Morus notabilis TaxID=981085 RepID=W9QTB3_9ROSA|nr:Disease resistance protein RPM1 [Morus notabilis]